jgi:beta-lactamase regulating signal transducer with metallopeptidase domain
VSPAAALVGALVNSLWQVAVLAGLFALLRLGTRGPALRHALGLFTVAAQVAWPAVTFVRLSALERSLDAAPTLETSGRWWWVVPAWLCGVLVMLVRFVGGLLVVRRWVQRGQVLSAPVLERFEALRARLQVRAVKWAVIAELEVPMTVGFLWPVVLVPASLLTAMPLEDLELVLAHELMHVRRWDYFFNLLQSLAEALLFFHPLLWWVSRATREEREFCCDDEVVGQLGRARPYALALVSLEQHRQEIPLAVASTGGSFLRRIARLQQARRGSVRRSWLTAFAIGLAVLVTAACTVHRAPAAQLIPVAERLKPALRQLCANIERTAALPELAQIPPADLATVVLATVNEENPGLEAFYGEVAKFPPADRLATFKRSVSAAIGQDWQCAKFDALWNER